MRRRNLAGTLRNEIACQFEPVRQTASLRELSHAGVISPINTILLLGKNALKCFGDHGAELTGLCGLLVETLMIVAASIWQNSPDNEPVCSEVVELTRPSDYIRESG